MPAFPSNATLLAAVQALSVTGVVRKYNFPPPSVDITNGYAAFPTMPDSSRGEQVSTCINNSKIRNIGYVVIIEAVGQSIQADNYGKLAAALDNLETALDGLTATANFVEYDLTTTGNYLIGDSAYWAVIANITARDI